MYRPVTSGDDSERAVACKCCTVFSSLVVGVYGLGKGESE